MRRAVTSLLTLMGGATLAGVPAATLAISSRVFTTEEQGWISLFVMIGTFVGQIIHSAVVESRLSSVDTLRRVVFPRWLAAGALLAALAVTVAPTSAVVLCGALPLILSALEVGRGVSVSERLDRRELASSIAVGTGAVAGLGAAFTGATWALIPLVAGASVATCVRCRSVGYRASSPSPSIRRWVVADTAITGVAYPALNFLILTTLGPTQAVIFTAISTVSGLLAIPLNFMRMRLLKEHSRFDIALAAVSLGGAVLVLLVLEFSGVLAFVFGEAWQTSATLVPLLLACAWRAASLATTIPFARLRRAGHARLLTGLRAASAALTFALAAIGLAVGELGAVFIGLLVAELATAVLYASVDRRVLGPHRG